MLKKKIEIDTFGFYNIRHGFYTDEYYNKLNSEPAIKSMGGVMTINGIAYEMNYEIIIRE